MYELTEEALFCLSQTTSGYVQSSAKSLNLVKTLVKILRETTRATRPKKRPLTSRMDHVFDEWSLVSSEDHQLSSVSLRNISSGMATAVGH